MEQRYPQIAPILLRTRHFFWLYPLVEFFRRQMAELQRRLTKAQVFMVRGVRNFGGFIVSDLWTERGDQHQRIVYVFLDASQIKLHSVYGVVHEGTTPVRQQSHRIEIVMDHHRFENVELKVSL